MLLKELQSRDVVNVVDGSKLGKITDIEIDFETGNILEITITKNKYLFGFGDTRISIPWSKIEKIGGEVIIVNVNNE